MGEDTYELEALLELREQEKVAAEERYCNALEVLGRCQDAVAEARRNRSRARGIRERARADFDEQVASGCASLAQMQSFHDYVRGLDAEEAQLQRQVEEAVEAASRQERVAKSAYRAFVDAQRELEAVSKHHEAWQRERSIVARRKESEMLDEIAARRWQEKRR